jgi:aminopeptidase YwaD
MLPDRVEPATHRRIRGRVARFRPQVLQAAQLLAGLALVACGGGTAASQQARTSDCPRAARPLIVEPLSLDRGSGDELATPAVAGTRRIPFWPDAVPSVLQKRVDGAYVLGAVRALGRYHRVQGSPGFRAVAEWLRGELTGAGLADASVEHLPLDGKTSYAHFKSYLGWNPVAGRLQELAPGRHVLAEFPDQPVALADYSQDADVTANLVDVGRGIDAGAYEGKDVRDRFVLADGDVALVHRFAVEERGATGIVSDAPNQRTAWSGLDPELVRWGHLSPYKTANRFAFMISPRTADTLRKELAHGAVRLTAHVRARMVPATLDIVSATIAGTDTTAGEIVLTAHLCHEQAGANDNASGSAALLGVARALRAAMAAGELPAPRRTIRFLWLPEISGSQAWLVSHPDVAGRLRAGVHLDMVGGRPELTHAALHLSRTAASLPHIVNEIAGAWVADVARASTVFAETGEGDGLVWPPGGRDALVTDLRRLELGSDHEVFEAFGVPMVYFHDWPDVTIHSNKDVPDNLDATKLGRVAYMAAGIAWTLAALPEAEAARLPALEREATGERLAVARHTALTGGWSADDARLAEREAVAVGEAELGSVAAMWPGTAAEVRRASAGLARWLPPRSATRVPASQDARVPERTAAVRGPLEVYYYNHMTAVLGDAASAPTALGRRSDVLAYEALNLVDGTRSVGEVRDLLTGRYEVVPLAEVSEWLDLLAKAGVIRFRAP